MSLGALKSYGSGDLFAIIFITPGALVAALSPREWKLHEILHVFLPFLKCVLLWDIDRGDILKIDFQKKS